MAEKPMSVGGPYDRRPPVAKGGRHGLPPLDTHKYGEGRTATVKYPKSSLVAAEVFRKYYGDAWQAELKKAVAANRVNKALNPGLGTRAIERIQVFRDKYRKDWPADAQQAAGFYQRSGPFIRMKPGIRRPTPLNLGDRNTAEHEIGHHLNYMTPATQKAVRANLPERGIISVDGKDMSFYGMSHPNELAQQLGQLQRQHFKHTGRRMSNEDFLDLVDPNKGVPDHFKVHPEKRYKDKAGEAGRLIHGLRSWRQSAAGKKSGKAEALINKILGIKDSFVDTGSSKFFPTGQMA